MTYIVLNVQPIISLDLYPSWVVMHRRKPPADYHIRSDCSPSCKQRSNILCQELGNEGELSVLLRSVTSDEIWVLLPECKNVYATPALVLTFSPARK